MNNLFVYSMLDVVVLNPELDDKDAVFRRKTEFYSEFIVNKLSNSNGKNFELPILSSEIDSVASLHCDKWLVGTARHLSLYTGSVSPPSLNSPPESSPLSSYKTAKYRNYSGDVSGVIGEALFGLLLTKYFKLEETDYAHFGTNSVIYPDFGVICASNLLRDSLATLLSSLGAVLRPGALARDSLIPAEVKSTTSPQNGSMGVTRTCGSHMGE